MKFLDIKNLTFEYFRRDAEGNVDEMIEALRDVSLDVKPGEFIAILGENGSGKSTLAKHINALLLPGEGQVIVDGMDTLDEEVRLEIRRTAGMVFQNPDNQIVANLVEEDIAFGPENLGVPTEEINTRVDSVLDIIGMKEYRGKSPNQLSGGQKQRVAIAGVLAMKPKCIIFDEATAMLDPKGRKQMIDTAKMLQKENGITIILITHHMDEVLFADKVFVMKDGEIAGEGSPKYIFKQKELLEECGLTLPAFYRYLYALTEQGILSEIEADRIHNEEELVEALLDKYADELVKKGLMTDIGTDELVHEDMAVSSVKEDLKASMLTEGIFLNNVSYYYNRGFENECVALNNVTFGIEKGEFVAVIGHTGSGKSTLMQHLNGLYLPTEGNVYFNGQDITDKDFEIKKLRQKVGLVFQYPEYQLFAETVEKDVCFGPLNMDIPKIEAEKRAYEAIHAVGLPDTIYDVSPLQLSGGQKRRVAIAGILAMNPDYLVLDEPTAGLDPSSAKELLDMLKALQEEQGITIVIVSHSMEEVAEYADRIIVMDKGNIAMDGKANEIFAYSRQLESLGLAIPVGMKMMYDLKNVGIEADVCRIHSMDICKELLRIFTF